MNTKTYPVTVIILTHRHDQRFINALASAQPAQEVLVVDYHSGNDWASLKKQFHFTKITQDKIVLNFSAERAAAMKQAANDWVFFLDSDEVIRVEDWAELGESIQNPDLAGVFVQRRDVFYGQTLRFGETGKTWLLRLTRKNTTKFARPVHETAMVSGATHHSKIVLLHYAHLSITEFLQDIARYAAIEAEYQTDSQLPVWALSVKTLAYPKAKFLVNYFLKLGLLDGWRGLVYAFMMSFHSLLVRVFSYENRKNLV